MKLAISATGPETSAPIDPRFGRCEFFIIADLESKEIESYQNPGLMATGGAGIQAAQSVAEKGAEIVITGNIGPNAYSVLASADIKIVTGISPNTTVEGAIKQFEDGKLQPTVAPSVGAHWGMGRGGGGGGGRGMGRGMGRGGY
jgi:predicted Fe-Mo cluster-binding NifX family protein